MLVHLVVGMGINTNFDCWPNIRHFDVNVMPRLSRNQREQAIGRLGAGQSAQILANAYNVNVRTIYRLQHRYNTTNSTNDRSRSGRPQSPHHDEIALFCANICKTDSPQQLRRLVIPLEHSNDPSVPTPLSTSCSRSYSYKPQRLQRATARQQWRYQQWRRVLFS